MTEKEKMAEKEFQGIDQALRRAAQTAKKLAEQNGTAYVVAESNSIDNLQQSDVAYKQ